jgi:hypothetical protein
MRCELSEHAWTTSKPMLCGIRRVVHGVVFNILTESADPG